MLLELPNRASNNNKRMDGTGRVNMLEYIIGHIAKI